LSLKGVSKAGHGVVEAPLLSNKWERERPTGGGGLNMPAGCIRVWLPLASVLRPYSCGARWRARKMWKWTQVAQEERLLGTDGASCLQFCELTADRLGASCMQFCELTADRLAALMFVSQAACAQTTSSVDGATPAPRSRNVTSCVGMESVTQYTHSTGFGNQTFIMAVHIEVCLSSKRLRRSECLFNR